MFESSNGNFDIQKEHINGIGYYVITSGLTENGVLGKTNVEAKIFDENTITIDMFGNAFYRKFKYKMVTHARVFSLKPNFEMTEKQGLFLTNSLYFLNKKFGYENMCSWAKITKEKIKLPTKNGEIDFEFMESFIAELESQKIAELKAYLIATGLNSFELTNQEEKLLADFYSFEWKEFKVSNLFEVISSKERFDANKVTISETGHPYVVRTSLNNGIRGYINENEQYLNDGNTISFGQDTATMFYQEQPYFTGDKIKIIKSKDNKLNRLNAQFFITSMAKTFSSFSWGASSFNVNIINDQLLLLPVKNNQPDYETMEILISALQKNIIKNVVLYTNQKIASTKIKF